MSVYQTSEILTDVKTLHMQSANFSCQLHLIKRDKNEYTCTGADPGNSETGS